METLKSLFIFLFFKANERMHTKNIPSTEMEVNNNYDQDNQENYIEMDPKMPLDQPDEEYDYVRMSRPENQENGKLDIQ